MEGALQVQASRDERKRYEEKSVILHQFLPPLFSSNTILHAQHPASITSLGNFNGGSPQIHSRRLRERRALADLRDIPRGAALVMGESQGLGSNVAQIGTQGPRRCPSGMHTNEIWVAPRR